ncbi:MAG: transporter related protein [Geminicoccaceae bacterium]|jgi:ATP-binding cassette subfamily F protein 3|nr:transporter related protein [Geminicoccaceae bacterium]
MTQIAMSGVVVEFGDATILRDVTVTVTAGEKWGIVGRNGTGKTTLFNLITGALPPTRGAVVRAPTTRVTLLEQHRDFGDAATVWQAVAGAFDHLLDLERSLADQATRIGELGEAATPQTLDRYAHDLERFEREGGYEITARVDAVLHGLGFDPTAARTKRLETLSGGERGRVGLARQLVAPSDVLLLDEPTNHLDLETTEWLEQYLRDTRATVLVISHDRAFLASVVDHILHLENGTTAAYAGGYESFVRQRTERRLTQQRAFDKQLRQITNEEDYIRRNIAGQNSKQAKGRRKRLERLPRLSPPPDESGGAIMAIRFDVAARGGDIVAAADRARIAIGDRLLVEEFSGYIHRGARVGLIGPNGAGKSTLLRTLIGELEPAGGTLRMGNSIAVAYYRQDLTQVPTDRSLYDIIAELRPTWERGQVQGHLGRFGFSGDEVQRRAESLSGGERARVALAMMMLARANLLILDEPTNHLDVESIEALEDAIERYDGTVIIVSHDRALLRALADRVWVLHDRHLTPFDGSFAEWEVVSAERAHAARVKAAEEAATHRMRERQTVTRRQEPRRDQRDALRRARRDAELAEQEVVRIEQTIAGLTTALADPELYTTSAGAASATRLGVELDAAKAELERAIDAWTTATEVVEALAASVNASA